MHTLFCISQATRVRCLRSNQSVNRRRRCIPVSRLIQKTETQRRRYCAQFFKKLVIFVLFPYKNYSRRFITSWLNYWWQMKYSGDAFHTFMDLDSAIYLAVNGTVTSLPVFIQNILNCFLKTNKAFTGSERHGAKWKMTILEYPFNNADLFSQPSLIIFTKGTNNSDHVCT